jgi:diguanylate cyclase (GGDEF)-like protein
MTGLYNRGYLDRAIVEERNKLEKYNINFSIVAVDINRLKQANDVYGHEAGDMLIKTVAERLQKSLREADIVARVGGDEFLVLLTNTGDKGAQAYTTRLRHNYFTDSSIKVKNNEDFPVTVSLGTAGTDCYSPDDLKKQADMSMYIDKEAYYKYEKKYR